MFNIQHKLTHGCEEGDYRKFYQVVLHPPSSRLGGVLLLLLAPAPAQRAPGDHPEYEGDGNPRNEEGEEEAEVQVVVGHEAPVWGIFFIR